MNDWENQWVDYYEILGIDRNANMKQIKKKYHKLMKKYHPDVYNGEDGIEKTQLINEAYDILSNPEKKKMYDLEYDRRLKSETPNMNSKSTEDNMNTYTEEEQQYAKKMAMKVVVEQELEKANIVIDTKNEIIYSAYDENIDKYAYYQNVKEFITMANEYIKGLYDLCELCDKYELFAEIETINEVILYLEGHIQDIPLSPSDAIKFMQIESKKENLMNMGSLIKSEIEESIHDIETLFQCVYQKQISHIEFNQFSESVLLKAKDVISKSRELVLLLSKNSLEIPELENILGKLGALVQLWPEDYEAASQIGKYVASKNSCHDALSQYEEYVQKIEKIIKIIKRYPVNHHVDFLYSYSKQLSQEITKILERALNNNGLNQSAQEMLEKAYSLSSEGEKIYQSATESSKKADEIYNTREIHSYGNKEIEILLKQAVNQFDKGKSLELLKEAGYHLHIFEEIKTLHSSWTQMFQTLNDNIKTVQQYNIALDTMMQTIDEIMKDYQSSMNIDVNQLIKERQDKLSMELISSIFSVSIVILVVGEIFGWETVVFMAPLSLAYIISGNITNNKSEKLKFLEKHQVYKEKCYKRYLDLKEGKVL